MPFLTNGGCFSDAQLLPDFCRDGVLVDGHAVFPAGMCGPSQHPHHRAVMFARFHHHMLLPVHSLGFGCPRSITTMRRNSRLSAA